MQPKSERLVFLKWCDISHLSAIDEQIYMTLSFAIERN